MDRARMRLWSSGAPLALWLANWLGAGCTATSPSASHDMAASSGRVAPQVLPPPSHSIEGMSSAPIKVEREVFAMGTRIYVAAYTQPDVNELAVNTAIDAALAEMRRLEALLSEWRDDSDVGRINEGAGDWVQVAPETLDVVERGIWAGELSHGAFDVTFQVMRGLWNFGSDGDATPRVPSAADVAQRRALIDYRNVQVDRAQRRIRLPRAQAMGLGGIAKGYIVDRAVSVLRRAGLTAFLVQAGGDLYGAGRKPDGSPWVSGVRDPRASENDFFATIALTDHAFSTAGDYSRSYVVDGRRYHHIIDPRTGYPATQSRSVTVWARDALTADAIDDAVFILGPEQGMQLAESLPDVGVIMVDAQNQVHVTANLEGAVRMIRPPTDGL